MVRCWTCSTKQEVTTGDVYVCESCENISDQIRSLEKTERDELSKIDDLIYVQRKGFDLLAEGMYEIASAIEWGFGEISWQLQQQTDILQEMTAVLKTPSATKANEWRQMGEELRRREVFDEAIEFFSKSLKTNPLDYRTYVGLGEIYLRIKKFNEAKKYFEKSLPHAPNEFYKSYSLRLIGRIYYCSEDYDHAIISLKEAVELSPSYLEACYNLAQYYGVIGDARKALHFLIGAIQKNSFYFYLSEKDRNFDPIRREFLILQELMKERAYKDAELEISKAKNTLEAAENFWGQFHVIKKDRKIRSDLKLATNKVASGDYGSILKAKSIAMNVYEVAKATENEVPRVKELLKGRQECLKFFNTSTALHLSFLFCFIIGISVSFAAFFIFYVVGAFLESLALRYWDWGLNKPYGSWKRPEFDSSELLAIIPGLIFAPLGFWVFLLNYFSSKRRIDKQYKSDLEEVSKIEGFW